LIVDVLNNFTDALENHGCRRRGRNMWTCPAHDDTEPSLSVDPGRNGGVVMKCHAGCDWRDILNAVGLTPADIRTEVERYPYRDEHGKVLNKKIRFTPKQFIYEHSLNGAHLPLYNLPEVMTAIKEGKRIWLVEGEKDANRLTMMGEVATANPNGAAEWHPEYTEALIGADVIIVADRDEPGYRHAQQVRKELELLSKSVRVVQSKTTGKGDDISDHLAAGHKLEELIPVTTPPAASVPYVPVNWDAAWKIVADDPEWLFEPVLESGTVNALFGKPGIGKSLLALSMAVDIAKRGLPVVYVDDENRIQDTVERLRAFGCHPGELGCLFMYSFAGLPPLDTPEGGRHLTAVAEQHGGKLIILDTTSRMVEGDENAASTYLQLYRCSLVPLKGRGMCVLRLDHPGKDDAKGMRGSSAKVGDVDTIWRLTEADGGEKFFLLREKSRSDHGQDMICLKRAEGPLRYIFDPIEYLPLNPKILAVARWLDGHECPAYYGRPKVRDFLNNTPGSPGIDTNELAVVVRYRKARLAQQSIEEAPF
jgi:5S rRNA maturation endonuclease (ribonuclease M5)